MKITIKDVAHVAGLARLRFKDDELEAMTAQLNGILDSFDKLQTVDTTGVEPSTHAVDVSNAFRDDTVRPSLAPEATLANAPEAQEGCFKVPRIIEV
ncbi:MAG: Asp-tRNA(Asn)/Glu-tRNA(Gln) amidotransferase subunit GatC [Proteobacteria bacterium]|nr:Asp-tRNA(Asn)/Glu-tRNA(Gln) amidotransferase subunit GatC [Pseudomonadota bacterium]